MTDPFDPSDLDVDDDAADHVRPSWRVRLEADDLDDLDHNY